MTGQTEVTQETPIEPAKPVGPVRKQYWVVSPGRTVRGHNYRRGSGATLSLVEATELRAAGVGLSFVKPEI